MTGNDMMKKIGLGEKKTLEGKNVKKFIEISRRTKIEIKKAKLTFDKYEKKAKQYIEKNPKKAVAMAAVAGALAGTLLSAMRGNQKSSKTALKTVPKKKM